MACGKGEWPILSVKPGALETRRTVCADGAPLVTPRTVKLVFVSQQDHHHCVIVRVLSKRSGKYNKLTEVKALGRPLLR